MKKFLLVLVVLGTATALASRTRPKEADLLESDAGQTANVTRHTQPLACLDHLLIISRRHLESVLAEFVLHYNRGRPHRGLELCTPEARAVVAPTKLVSRLRSKKILGGLIHEYELAA